MVKTFTQRLSDFFLFSSLYIALCAVIMVFQTYQLLLKAPPSAGLCVFVFFATVCSYNFHWYLTPHSVADSQRIHWAQTHKGWHLFLYFVGVAGSLASFIAIREHWPALAFGAFVTFLYSAPKLPQTLFKGLKKIAIGKTIFLSIVWTYVTTVLPIVISGADWQPDCTLFMASRFFLIYAICIVFDYRDREDDKNEGVKSVVTYLGERGIDCLFYISLAFFATATILLYRYHPSILTILFLLVPGIMVAALYRYAKRNFSDYLYYFVLDGLMMFSGLLMLLFRI